MKKLAVVTLAVGVGLVLSAGVSNAGPLTDRVSSGEPIRLGFSNVPVFGFPDEQGRPKGFANEIALDVLKRMGYTDVEATVTDWSGLIPGLQANRYDLITGGMYILTDRCKNVAFSEPIAKTGDAFIVPAGNPKGINTYKDIAEHGATFMTYTGSSTARHAAEAGVPDSKIMTVPGPTEVLAAVKSGRVDAGSMTYFEAKFMADTSDGTIDVTDPAALPEETYNWVGIGFRSADADFLAAFNEALRNYVGSEEMMTSVAEYGLDASNLPGDKTTEWVCQNRQ